MIKCPYHSYRRVFEGLASATNDRLNSKGNYGKLGQCAEASIKFMKGGDITLGQIDESWLMAFKQYLLQEAKIAGGNMKLSQNSALSYFNKVKAAMRQAFEEKLIQENPAARVRSIKPAETKREEEIIFPEEQEGAIFPNPAEGKLIIRSAKTNNLRLINSFGHTVYRADFAGSTEVDISSMNRGIYIVELITNDKQLKPSKVVFK